MSLDSPNPTNAPTTTIDQFKLPLSKRLFNEVGKALKLCGISPVDLSEESLMKAASRRTGLSDWGDDGFRVPLNVLLDAYEREANLTLLGRVMARSNCIRLLSNRLRIQDDLKRHPEILKVPIRRPLFVVGLPRTGTTLLHNLLSQDPAARVPLMWELTQPSPPPRKETRETDRRIKETQKRIEQLFALAPQLFSIHAYNPTGPEECIHLFQNSFTSYLFVISYHIPQYREWLLQCNMIPAYRYYRQQLQLLQWRCPGEHWVLKSPAHLYSLDALLKVFPDACLVHTHRDPKKVIPSVCSLATMAMQMSSDIVGRQIDLKYIGERGISLGETAIGRAVQVRESADPGQFYDVRYQDLMADPVGVVRRIYEYFKYDFDPRMEEGMKRWLSANPQGKYGLHRYSLDQFGLDGGTVDAHLADYMNKFNIK